MLQTVGFTEDRLLQFLDARFVLAVGLDEVAHDAELLHQTAAVQIERMLLHLVEHDEDRRALAEAVDQAQPVVGIGILVPLTAIEHDQVQAPLRQEKLMRRMHDFLTAEVPDVQADIFSIL